MLNGVHLVDFGNHRDTRLTFGPITALVGQNGSGKTTVMRAIQEVGRAMSERERWRRNENFLRRHGTEAIVTCSWDIGRSVRSKAGVRLGQETEWYTHEGTGAPIWIPDPKQTLSPFDILDEEASQIVSATGKTDRRADPAAPWRCRYFKATGSLLQQPAISDPGNSILSDDGSNLAWAVTNEITEEPDRFAQILDSLREIVPVVTRIRSRAVSLTRIQKQVITINKKERAFDEEREVAGQELVFDMKSGDSLSATLVSEGTLVVLAVLTLVHSSQANLIMLDDVELGLHPKAQRDLIRHLEKVQKRRTDLQILVSTHSPYVVDEFEAEDVWVFAPDSEGCAVTKRLSDHPDAKRALDVLTTGEFWSAQGEPWVLAREPTSRVAEEPHA
jgi:predicted ATPase